MSRRTGLVIKTVLLEQPNLHDTGLGVQSTSILRQHCMGFKMTTKTYTTCIQIKATENSTIATHSANNTNEGRIRVGHRVGQGAKINLSVLIHEMDFNTLAERVSAKSSFVQIAHTLDDGSAGEDKITNDLEMQWVEIQNRMHAWVGDDQRKIWLIEVSQINNASTSQATKNAVKNQQCLAWAVCASHACWTDDEDLQREFDDDWLVLADIQVAPGLKKCDLWQPIFDGITRYVENNARRIKGLIARMAYRPGDVPLIEEAWFRQCDFQICWPPLLNMEHRSCAHDLRKTVLAVKLILDIDPDDHRMYLSRKYPQIINRMPLKPGSLQIQDWHSPKPR